MTELKPVASFTSGEDESEESFFRNLLLSGDPQSDPASSNGNMQQYICDICGSCFPCQTYLKRHLKNVHVEINAEHQQCPKCPMTFKKYDTFWEHVIRVHENPSSTGEAEGRRSAGVYEISELSSTAEDEELVVPSDENEIEALVESLISEEDDKVCKKCGKRLCGKKNVKRHIREVHLKLPASKNASGRVTCQVCDRTFVNNSVYNAHMRNIHLQPEPTLECPKCMRKFKDTKGLRRHLKDVHHVVPDNTSTKLATTTAIITARASAHNGADNDSEEQDSIFSCSKCEIQFVSLEGLNRHNKNIHGINTTPIPPNLLKKEIFDCPVCCRKFPNKNALSDHLIVHQKASLEPHVKAMLRAVFGGICNSKLTCGICGTEVLNSVEGRLHVYIKHPEKFDELVTQEATSTQGLSQCTYCEEKLPLESMISHIESNHADKYIPTCTQCGHKELTERYINLHYKQFHPEVSRYNCDVCRSQFNQRRDLLHHMKSKHSASSVQCPYCPEKHVKVKLHVTVKHPEKAEEYTEMKKTAIREEQVARKRFNQFLEKGTIPRERANLTKRSKANKPQRRKKGCVSDDSEQDSEEENDSDDNVEYDEDGEIVDIKPNVCFVKETQKVAIPELYALQKDITTPHRIEVRRLPPPPPPPPEEIEIVGEEITEEKDRKHSRLDADDDEEDIKPDVNQLKVCVIINPTVDSASRQRPLEKTLVPCLERLTNDQIAHWMPSSSHTSPVPTFTGSPLVKSSLSEKQAVCANPNTSRRGRKRRRR